MVAEFTVTESTLDETGIDPRALSAGANCVPFSSSCSRSLVGVEEEKNLFQLAVICETAADELPLAVEAAVAGVDNDGLLDAAAAGEEALELLEVLEQAEAKTAVTSMRPSAGAA